MISLLSVIGAATFLFSAFARCEQYVDYSAWLAGHDQEAEAWSSSSSSSSSDSCPNPLLNFPAGCLNNPFSGCNCPPGYVLVVTTNLVGNNYAYCQLTCLNSQITGCSNSTLDIPQCLGSTIPLSNCTLVNIGGQFCQNADGGSCGNLVVADGNYYCIAPDANSAQPSNPCGCGFGSQCSLISDVACNALTAGSPALQPLQSLSCTPCCPPEPQVQQSCCNSNSNSNNNRVRYW